jgi:hypothetical protein
MVVPGTYKVSLQQFDGFQFTELVAPQSFKCISLNNSSLPSPDQLALDAFNKKVAELSRVITGADAFRNDMAEKVKYFKKAVLDAASVPPSVNDQLSSIDKKLADVNKQLNGDGLRTKYESVSPISVKSRVDQITSSLWTTTSAPTETFTNSYAVAADNFGLILTSLQSIAGEIAQLEVMLENLKVPYTPGRIPTWNKN